MYMYMSMQKWLRISWTLFRYSWEKEGGEEKVKNKEQNNKNVMKKKERQRKMREKVIEESNKDEEEEEKDVFNFHIFSHQMNLCEYTVPVVQ